MGNEQRRLGKKRYEILELKNVIAIDYLMGNDKMTFCGCILIWHLGNENLFLERWEVGISNIPGRFWEM